MACCCMANRYRMHWPSLAYGILALKLIRYPIWRREYERGTIRKMISKAMEACREGEDEWRKRC